MQPLLAPARHADSGTSHLSWRAEALWQQLEPYLPGLSVEVLAHSESTNSLLLDRARQGVGRRAGDSQPCLLVAEHQSLGRGRLGRGWQSAAGRSLTFSLGLPLAAPDWSGLSLAVGVALADALDAPEPGCPPRLRLKWPNDLWLADGEGRGRKLGGVLIETVAVGQQRMAVVGVGLNIAPLDLPAAGAEFSHGFACLQEIDAQATAPATLLRVALPLVKALSQFEREGFAGFASSYARRDLLRGHAVVAHDAASPGGAAGDSGRLEGRAEGVCSKGALLLRAGDTVHSVSSGEVSIRLAVSTAPPP